MFRVQAGVRQQKLPLNGAVFAPAQEKRFRQQQSELAATYAGGAAFLAAAAYGLMTTWHVFGATPELRTSNWFVPFRLAIVFASLLIAYVLLKPTRFERHRPWLINCLFAAFAFLPALQGPFRLPELNVYQGLSAIVGTVMLGAIVIRLPWRGFALMTTASVLAYIVMLKFASGAAMPLTPADYVSAQPPLIMFVQLIIIVGVALVAHQLIERRERQSFIQSVNVEKLSAQRLFLLEALGHDLQQPLTALNLQSAMAMNAVQQGRAEEAKQSLYKAEKTLQWARDELEQLTDVAILSDADHQPVLQVCSLKNIVQPITEALQEVALEKNLTLQLNLQVDGEIKVLTNQALLQRVLSNLVCNAINYGQPSKDQTLPRRVLIKCRLSSNQPLIRIAVVDQGQGIPPEELSKVWQPLFRASNIDRQLHPGRGFGLTMVHAAIKKLPNHRVTVRSELKKGSTFELSVPISPIDRAIEMPVGR
jgi:signal transduction histidine kinase